MHENEDVRVEELPRYRTARQLAPEADDDIIEEIDVSYGGAVDLRLVFTEPS